MTRSGTDGAPTALLDPGRYSETQRRSIDAAFALFASHGVSGTSFQMIADAVGVTKAAIYHQFRTKDAVVLAVAEVGLAPLEEALVEAEGAPSAERGRELLLTSVIDLAVSRRQWVNALQGDPIMIQLLGSHPPFVELMHRVYALLLGVDPNQAAMVRTALIAGAIGAAIANPLVAELDDETLRGELLAATRRLIDIG